MARLLLFLIPQSFSLLGSSIAQFGIIWTLTLSYSSGKILLLASIAAFIPQIALMILSGVLSDKRKRKRVIILSDLFSALIALLFSLSIGEGISLYLCLFVLAARSAASGLQTPAVESALPLIAGSDNLKRANGMKGLLSSVVMLLSPVLAGILLPSFGLSGLMVLDAITALLAIVMLLPFSNSCPPAKVTPMPVLLKSACLFKSITCARDESNVKFSKFTLLKLLMLFTLPVQLLTIRLLLTNFP